MVAFAKAKEYETLPFNEYRFLQHGVRFVYNSKEMICLQFAGWAQVLYLCVERIFRHWVFHDSTKILWYEGKYRCLRLVYYDLTERLFNYEPDSHRTTQYIGILADLRTQWVKPPSLINSEILRRSLSSLICWNGIRVIVIKCVKLNTKITLQLAWLKV